MKTALIEILTTTCGTGVVGPTLGAKLGTALGAELGKELGVAIGDALGSELGRELGAALGDALGSELGEALGWDVGGGRISELEDVTSGRDTSAFTNVVTFRLSASVLIALSSFPFVTDSLMAVVPVDIVLLNSKSAHPVSKQSSVTTTL
jgi:hypothetical protein